MACRTAGGRDPAALWRMARRNLPLAAADAVEWGSRRVDIAVLGLFFSPAVRRHLLRRPERRVAAGQAEDQLRPDPRPGDRAATRRRRQSRRSPSRCGRSASGSSPRRPGSRWRSAFPGEAVMGLVGPAFVAGTAALAFLLAAEVVAATAAVSEAALVYVARHRNMLTQPGHDRAPGGAVPSALILLMQRALELPLTWQAAGAGDRAAARAGLRRRSSSRGCCAGLLDAPVSGWRWPLIWAARGRRCRSAQLRHPAAGMGRAADRHPGDPDRVRRDRCGPRLRPRGPRAVPDAQGGDRGPAAPPTPRTARDRRPAST